MSCLNGPRLASKSWTRKPLKSFILVLVLLSVLVTAGCLAPKELRKKARAERLVSKAISLNPSLAEQQTITIRDTITLTDTVVTPGSKADTIFQLLPGDTITITEESTRVKLVRQIDTFYLEVEQLPDTIYIEKQVPIEVQTQVQTIKPTKWYSWALAGYRWVWALLILVGGIVLTKILRG